MVWENDVHLEDPTLKIKFWMDLWYLLTVQIPIRKYTFCKNVTLAFKSKEIYLKSVENFLIFPGLLL